MVEIVPLPSPLILFAPVLCFLATFQSIRAVKLSCRVSLPAVLVPLPGSLPAGCLSSAARASSRDGSVGRAQLAGGCRRDWQWKWDETGFFSGGIFFGDVSGQSGVFCVFHLSFYLLQLQLSLPLRRSLNHRIQGFPEPLLCAKHQFSSLSFMVSLFSGQFSSCWSRLSLTLPMIKSFSFSSRANSHA